MTAPTPLERLEQALAELGALTPDGIANRARAKGIKGVQHDPCLCILARLLRAIFADPGVDIDSWFIVVDTEAAEISVGGTDWVIVDLPASAQQLVDQFDRGVYLDLVEVSA